MIWLLALHWVMGAEPFITQTDIVEPGSRWRILISDERHFYIKSSYDRAVFHYDDQGQWIGKIGGPGQGPGELDRLGTIQIFDDHLYIWDGPTVTKFRLDGTFVEEVQLPVDLMGFTYRVKGGWVNLPILQMQGDGFAVTWQALDLSKTKTLVDFTEQQSGGAYQMFGQSWQPAEPRPDGTVPFNPVPERIRLHVNRAGTRAYFRRPGAFEVFVYDFVKQAMVFHLHKEVAPAPFDADWGDRSLAQFEKALADRLPGHPGAFADYPSHFPFLARLEVGFDDILMIPVFTKVGGVFEPLFFDADFQPIELPYSQAAFSRILMIEDGVGYIHNFEDDQVSIVKVPIAEINQYVEDHPLEVPGCLACE